MRKTLAITAAALLTMSGAAYAQATDGAATQAPNATAPMDAPATEKAPAMKPMEGRAASHDPASAARKAGPVGDSNGNNRTGANGS